MLPSLSVSRMRLFLYNVGFYLENYGAWEVAFFSMVSLSWLTAFPHIYLGGLSISFIMYGILPCQERKKKFR